MPNKAFAALVAFIAFLIVNAFGWFCFWIGGGEMFTEGAGATAVMSGCVSMAVSFGIFEGLKNG